MRRKRCYPNRGIDERIKRVQERLEYYYNREKEILDKNGVKSYSIGPRSLSRYDTSLKDIYDMIEKLEAEHAELNARKCGGTARRAVGVVPRDW